MRVVGLDLSLTSTGVAIIESHGVEVARVVSKGSRDATLRERSARLTKVQHACVTYSAGADLVAIEGPSFAQSVQAGTHDRAGLWWLVVDLLTDAGLPVVEIPPKNLKVYATGKGNAAKDAVLAAVVRRYPDVEVQGNDEADALVLAAMGARHLGHPIEDSLPTLQLRALEKIRWPGDA